MTKTNRVILFFDKISKSYFPPLDKQVRGGGIISSIRYSRRRNIQKKREYCDVYKRKNRVEAPVFNVLEKRSL